MVFTGFESQFVLFTLASFKNVDYFYLHCCEWVESFGVRFDLDAGDLLFGLFTVAATEAHFLMFDITHYCVCELGVFF